MALSADPSATADFVFERVGGDPLALKTRFLTSREKSAHARLIDLIEGKSYDDESILPPVREAITIGIVGTTVEDLESKLTRRELVQVASGYPAAAEISEVDSKKSRLRLPTRIGTADSASNAAAGVASTPPAPSGQSS